jgi:hypothetical protein
VCELNCPPIPPSAIDIAPALLLIAIDPTTVPAIVGAKVTLTAAVWPGEIDIFVLSPLAVNPAPVSTTLEIVTLAFPVFVKLTAAEVLLPTATVPKLRLVALAPSTAVGAVALPLAATKIGELGASLFNVSEPEKFPPAIGVNTKLNVMAWPAAMLAGNVSPVVLKPAPVTLTVDTVALAVPSFCSVMVCELLDPMATPGKFALDGVTES